MLPSQQPRNHHLKPKTNWYDRESFQLGVWLSLGIVSILFLAWALTQLFVELQNASL